MYPGSAKFQTRPASPQFNNFSGDYPHGMAATASNTQTASGAVHNVPGVGIGIGAHHSASMSMRHTKANAAAAVAAAAAMSTGPSTGGTGKSQRNINTTAGHHMMSGAATMGHHRGDLIFPDEMDSIEFCMPPPPAPTNGGIAHGVNGELMLMHGGGGAGSAMGPNGLCDAFTERRRRGHSRRSNHKMDVEQQVKWSRKNIAATMERFEPTASIATAAGPHSSSSTSSLEYGFAAGVVTPTSSTPSHHHSLSGASGHSPAPPHGYNGAPAAGAPFNHVYSYAYYEPGAAKCHTNIPHKDMMSGGPSVSGISQAASSSGAAAVPSKSPPRNSIRALLAKSFRSKSSSNSGQSTSSSPSTEERHTYTTRYGTTENLYEEVNEQKIRKVLSDNRIATSSIGNVKEELRRVQHNHFRVLDELNLSLEALIMPPTPPDISPSHGGNDDDEDGPSTSTAAAAAAAAAAQAVASGSHTHSSRAPRRGGLLGGAASSSSSTTSSQQRTLSHASLENLSTTLNSMELKDHAHSSCINPEFDEGDLDSGFSGSGSSSGASYNESLRYYKTTSATNHHQQQQQHQQQQHLHHQSQQLHHHHHHLSAGVAHNNHHHHHQQQQQQQQQQLPLSHHNNNNNNLNNNNHMQTTITTTLPHNLRSCRSSTASGTSTSKSSMTSCEDQGIAGMGMSMLGGGGGGVGGGLGGLNGCGAGGMSPFNYPRRCSADTQRASGRSISAGGAGAAAAAVMTASTAAAASTATGTKPKKNFWNIKP